MLLTIYAGAELRWCSLQTCLLLSQLLFRLQELIPELSAAVEKVGFTWKDFTVTDNTCKPHPPQKSLVQVGTAGILIEGLSPCCCFDY
jgi:hypothetical protein